MQGLSSLERIVLEAIDQDSRSFADIVKKSGLEEKVCYFIIQKLIRKELIIQEQEFFKFNSSLDSSLKEFYFGEESKKMEHLEIVESIMDFKTQNNFKMKRIAMSDRDYHLFNAILMNMESFLKDVHEKSKKEIPVTKQRIVFWGMESSANVLHQLNTGAF